MGAPFIALLVAIAIPLVSVGARVVPLTAISIRHEGYVEAATAIGASSLRIMWCNIAPNSVVFYSILIMVYIGTAIVGSTRCDGSEAASVH